MFASLVIFALLCYCPLRLDLNKAVWVHNPPFYGLTFQLIAAEFPGSDGVACRRDLPLVCMATR